MPEWIDTVAKDLRVGDILEPDGAEVTKVTTDNQRVEVTLKPGQRSRTSQVWLVTPGWPFRLRIRRPPNE